MFKKLKSLFSKDPVEKFKRAYHALPDDARMILKSMTWDNWTSALEGHLDDPSSWPSYSTKEKLEIYKKNAVIYSCLNKITFAFNEADVEQVSINGDIIENPLLKTPNEWMTFGNIMTFSILNLLLSGNSYIWK